MAIRISLKIDSVLAQNCDVIQVLLMYMLSILATVRALFRSHSELAIVELALRQQLAFSASLSTTTTGSGSTLSFGIRR